MSAPSMTPAVREAQDYLAAVEHELADLPADDRSALLEDLALHLDALAAEDDDDRPMSVRLGAPAAYAADLRAAAGLPARGTGAAPATTGAAGGRWPVRAPGCPDRGRVGASETSPSQSSARGCTQASPSGR